MWLRNPVGPFKRPPDNPIYAKRVDERIKHFLRINDAKRHVSTEDFNWIYIVIFKPLNVC